MQQGNFIIQEIYTRAAPECRSHFLPLSSGNSPIQENTDLSSKSS